MATTIHTTWTQIFSDSWENAYNADPNHDIDLTTSQRKEFLKECRNHLCAEADQILATYGAGILGNGEIIGQWGDERWPEPGTDEHDDMVESLAMIDFDDVICHWLTLTD